MPALRQNAGKGAVVDGPGAAGGAALLEHGGLGPGEPGQLRRSLRAPPVRRRHIPVVPGDHPVPLNLRRRPGRGQSPENLPAHGDHMVLFAQGTGQGMGLALPVVPAGDPQQARADQNRHSVSSFPFRQA